VRPIVLIQSAGAEFRKLPFKKVPKVADFVGERSIEDENCEDGIGV
jgi:hypothetical protein